MKKGELSINIIVIAAIALLILVIISVLLFGTGGRVVEGTSCDGIGGICEPRGTRCSDLGEGYTRHPTASCPDREDVCCIRIGSDN